MLTVHSTSLFHRLASPQMHRRVRDSSSTLFLFWAQTRYGKVFDGRRKLLRTVSGTDACVNIDRGSSVPVYRLQPYWFIPYDSVSTQRLIQRRTTNIKLRLVLQFCTTEIIQRRKTVTTGHLLPYFPFSCSSSLHSPVFVGHIHIFTWFSNYNAANMLAKPSGHRLVHSLRLAYVASYNPYPTAFPYGNGMVLHFYQRQESSTTKTVHKVINKGLKAYV